VGPFYLARALGLDALRVGFVLSAGPLVAALAGVPAGRLVDRIGAARTVLAGLAGMAMATLVLAALPTAAGVAGYVAALVTLTTSYALFQAANNTALTADAPQQQRGLLSGLLNLSRNIGLVTGAAAMGAVFAAATGEVATAPAAAVAAGMRITFAVAGGLLLLELATATRAQRQRGS
jgi:MFS family permease